MSFLYILSKEMDVIDFAREKSDRYNILNEIVNEDIISIIENHLYPLNIDKHNLEYVIINLLKNRELDAYYIDYKNRFQEDDIFSKIIFNNKTYTLCNSGFDNKILFLINIFNYIKDISENIYILKVKNHKIFKDIVNNHR